MYGLRICVNYGSLTSVYLNLASSDPSSRRAVPKQGRRTWRICMIKSKKKDGASITACGRRRWGLMKSDMFWWLSSSSSYRSYIIGMMVLQWNPQHCWCRTESLIEHWNHHETIKFIHWSVLSWAPWELFWINHEISPWLDFHSLISQGHFSH